MNKAGTPTSARRGRGGPRIARRLCLGLLGALLLGAAYLWVSTELPTPERLRERAALGDTRVLDRRGRLLAALPDPLTGARRPLPPSEIPLALRQATVAVEDASFYENPGVEPRGILRAAWENLRRGEIVAGGSTITQQLARNFLLDPQLAGGQSLERKLREAVLALKLTAAYSKDEILALYLNQSYYGGWAYGVEAAAWRFFGKPARDLDLAESALLAGLPQAPSRYDPLSAGREAALRRQREVLGAMVRAGYITEAQAAAAAAEPLQFASGGCRDGAVCREQAPHFVLYALDQLAQELGPEALARGGLTITTTLDAALQATSQTILRRQIAALADTRDGGPDHAARSGAVVVLDPRDGAILAMVGSPDFFDSAAQGQVNAAVAPRQPGSALKPLLYAAALERGWTPATTLLDVPTAFTTREGRPYRPQNYDRAFHGPLALRDALATSSNVAAVRTLDAIGVPALLDMAARLGITTLGRDSGRYGLALALGGGEVTPLELTAAYASFAAGGRLVQPYAIIAVTDAQGRSLMWREEEGPAPSVLSPQVAFLITDILSDRYARMRAFGGSSALDLDRPAAVKTGTTTDWRDNWTLGYTPDRAVGVWVGNADGRPMEAVSGVSGAGPVWRAVMQAAHRGIAPRPFQRPPGIEEETICAEGGMLPGPHCPATRRELFIAGTAPTRQDDTHVALRIDPRLGCRAPEGYPAERAALRVFRVLPPEAELWALEAGLPQIPRAVCQPVGAGEPQSDGARGQAEQAQPAIPAGTSPHGPIAPSPAPAVVTPAPGAVFALSPGVPRERQQVEIAARGAPDTVKLTILLDDAPLASFGEAPYRVFWRLAPGRHTISVVSLGADGTARRGEPVEFFVVDDEADLEGSGE